MDEIILKAWDFDAKTMSEAFHPYYTFQHCVSPEDPSNGNVKLLRFAGQIDSGGNDIFEGDIVKSNNGDLYEIKYCEAAYDELLAFYPIDREDKVYCYHYGGWSGDEFTILGNIYENPTLMD